MNVLKQIKIILWAFLGVRSNQGKNDDVQLIKNPLVFLGIGFLMFIFFIIALIIIVNIIA